MRRPAVPAAAAAVLAAALAAGAPPAHANGRFPSSMSVAFRPGNHQDIYLGVTFGFLLSHDETKIPPSALGNYQF